MQFLEGKLRRGPNPTELIGVSSVSVTLLEYP